MEFTIKVSIPVDDDGFLRRQCKGCVAEFKVPSDDDREIRSCPHCGRSDDDWLTSAQNAFMTAHAEAATLPLVEDLVGDMFDSAFRGSRNITVRRGPRRAPSAPTPLSAEVNDMAIHAMGCGARVKVPDGKAPSWCWACGEAA